MKLINNSKMAYSHNKYILPIGGVVEVPQKVADIWLKYPGITQYVSPADLEEEKRKAVEEALKKERQKTVKKTTAKKTVKK